MIWRIANVNQRLLCHWYWFVVIRYIHLSLLTAILSLKRNGVKFWCTVVKNPVAYIYYFSFKGFQLLLWPIPIACKSRMYLHEIAVITLGCFTDLAIPDINVAFGISSSMNSCSNYSLSFPSFTLPCSCIFLNHSFLSLSSFLLILFLSFVMVFFRPGEDKAVKAVLEKCWSSACSMRPAACSDHTIHRTVLRGTQLYDRFLDGFRCLWAPTPNIHTACLWDTDVGPQK